MRGWLLCLGLTGSLGAQVALHIIGVERQGLPPYDQEGRIYRLDGGQDRGLRVGGRLVVKHPGDIHALGHLWVTVVQAHQAETRFEPNASAYPMKGDLALVEVLRWMPSALPLEEARLPLLEPPRSAPEAPPREGVLYFLPQQAELSVAGVKKLESWVEQWGAGGRWVIQVPATKALSPALQQQRADALKAALRSLGIEQVALEKQPRTAEGKYDPAWVRHWD